MNYISAGLLLLGTATCWCLDTTEAFEKGLSDFEFYMNQSGSNDLGRAFSSESIIGIGLTKRLSLGVGYAYDSEDKTNVDHISGQLFFNALHYGPFQLDIMVNDEQGGHTELATESNMDFRHWGLQMTCSKSFSAHQTGLENEFVIEPMLYGSLGPKCQLLLATNWDEKQGFSNNWALGVNYALNDLFELVTQVNYCMRPDQISPQWNVSFGFITTVL